MSESEQPDPHRILLNMTGFRGKFHIYEIAWGRPSDGAGCVVRKQLLSHASLMIMQEIRKSEKHVELHVDREAVADVYELVRDLSLPATRTDHAGKDGTWYGLQIGIPPCSTTIRWWSDVAPELKPVYKLRDKMVTTIKRIIRSTQTDD